MMRKRIATALAALLLCGGAQARAEELLFDGTVAATQTQSITAPFGGTVGALDMREGELVQTGDTLAQIQATKVFSPMDGTVRGISVQPGDSAAQTLFSIAPVSKFTITASVEKAYESVETMYVVPGERLYISCSKDGTHRAEGIVVAVDGMNFTVETDKGELYMEEKVYLYRSKDYDATTRVGYGAVARTEQVDVKGTGSLLALHVEEGEEVERGQLLFETVDGTFEAGQTTDTSVCAQTAGVIAQIRVKAGDTVRQDDVIATMYVPEDFRIVISIPEDQVALVKAGDAARVTLYAQGEEGETLAGTVSEISYLTDEETGEIAYSAYIELETTQQLRLGMTASVVLTTGGA